MTTIHRLLDTPVGKLTVVGDGETVTGLYFDAHSTRPDRARFGPRADQGFEALATELDEYFAGSRTEFGLAMHVAGSPFQREIWALLVEIPYGETTTYGALARAVGRPGEARKVGGAVARNPISIIVPCHRVIGADGGLTGYAGGLARKRALLDLETGVSPLLGLQVTPAA